MIKKKMTKINKTDEMKKKITNLENRIEGYQSKYVHISWAALGKFVLSILVLGLNILHFVAVVKSANNGMFDNIGMWGLYPVFGQIALIVLTAFVLGWTLFKESDDDNRIGFILAMSFVQIVVFGGLYLGLVIQI